MFISIFVFTFLCNQETTSSPHSSIKGLIVTVSPIEMGTVFGKKTAKSNVGSHELSSIDEAILKLKQNKTSLNKVKEGLESDKRNLDNKARELIRNNQKDRAVLVIKMKRLREKKIDETVDHIFQIDNEILNVQSAHINVQTLQTLELATKELNRMHEIMPIEKIQMLMEESREAVELENEYNQVFIDHFDEFVVEDSELQAELAALMNETNEAPIKPDTNVAVLHLPDAPTGPIVTSNKDKKETAKKEKKLVAA